MRRKEERSKQGQTNNKAKQHSTPKAVTFPKKNELYMYVMCTNAVHVVQSHTYFWPSVIPHPSVCIFTKHLARNNVVSGDCL